MRSDRGAGTRGTGDTVLGIEVTKVHLNAGITGKGEIEIINIPNLKKIPITRIGRILNKSARLIPARPTSCRGSCKSV